VGIISGPYAPLSHALYCEIVGHDVVCFAGKARKSKEPGPSSGSRLKALADKAIDHSPRNKRLPACGCGLFR
jgi:hypothetical protein